MSASTIEKMMGAVSLTGGAKIMVSDLSVETIQYFTDVARAGEGDAMQWSDESIMTYHDAEGNPLPGSTVDERRAYAKELVENALKTVLGAFSATLSNTELEEIGPTKVAAILEFVRVMTERHPAKHEGTMLAMA